MCLYIHIYIDDIAGERLADPLKRVKFELNKL